MEFVTKRKIKKRNAMISIAKAIGIILMVTGHSLMILALHYPLIKVFDFYLREDLGEHTTLQHFSGG